MKHPYATVVFLLVLLGMGLCLGSCTQWAQLLSRDMSLRLNIEKLDSTLEQTFPGCRVSWNIRWYDGKGRRKEVRIEGRETVITVEKDVFTPIIAVPAATLPLAEGDYALYEDLFPPRGSIFPLLRGLGDTGMVVRLDVLGGIGAECAEAILLGAADGFNTGRRIAEACNWFRFQYLTAQLDHPTRLNRDSVVLHLLNGTMRESYIKELSSQEYSLRLPEHVPSSGILWAADPANDAIHLSGSPVHGISLAKGLHRWYCPGGMLVVQVQSGKVESLFFTSFRLR